MTIRDYIKRRYWLAYGVGFVGFFVVMNIVVRFTRSPNIVVPAVLAVVVAPAALILWSIRCPNCKRRLGQTIGKQVALPLGADPPKLCPYCGVSLDEEIPEKNDLVR